MDTPPPDTVDENDLRRRVSAEWDVRMDAVRYLPKGAGSYHWLGEIGAQPACFITVDDLDTKPWIAADRDATFIGLTAAYETAWRLRHDARLEFVVAALERRDGRIVRRLDDRYALSVFPFVHGTAGEWGDPLTVDHRTTLLEELALLHQARVVDDRLLPTRPFAVAEGPGLAAALDELDDVWEGGPFAADARRAVQTHAADVRRWMHELDVLADEVFDDPDAMVITHREPHPANLIRTGDALLLIDWDTVGRARPERDLWMLDTGSPDDFAVYERRTSRAIRPGALRYYQLEWTLSDIASFVELFRSPHERTQWVAQKWDGFQRLLSGEPSRPYGRSPT